MNIKKLEDDVLEGLARKAAPNIESDETRGLLIELIRRNNAKSAACEQYRKSIKELQEFYRCKKK